MAILLQQSNMDNTMLNKFYEKNVKMIKDETKQIIDFVNPVVENILEYVHKKDKRFQIQPLNVGSYYSHTKVSRADEFDYSVVLDVGSTFVWGPGKPIYYGMDRNNKEVVQTTTPLAEAPVGKCTLSSKQTIQKWDKEGLNKGSACLTIDHHIIPQKVKRRFKELVSEAVNRPEMQDKVKVQRLSESPAATLTINDPNNAGDPISVDLAPLIKASAPFISQFGWPRPGISWPSYTKIQEIKGEGIHLVAKDPKYWSLSFVTCEKKLLDDESKGTIRYKSQRIMKKLRDIWCPKGRKQILTSYHLKNIYFCECENHPTDSDWTKEQLCVRVKSMCNLLIKRIQLWKLPVYFHTGIDLFKNKDKKEFDKVELKITDFLEKPKDYLI